MRRISLIVVALFIVSLAHAITTYIASGKLLLYDTSTRYYVLSDPDEFAPAILVNSPATGVTLYTVDKWYGGTILPDYVLVSHDGFTNNESTYTMDYNYIVSYTSDTVVYIEHFVPNTAIVTSILFYNYTSSSYVNVKLASYISYGFAKRGETVQWVSGSLPTVSATTLYGTVNRLILAINTTAVPLDLKTGNEIKVRIEMKYTVPDITVVKIGDKYYVKLVLSGKTITVNDTIAPHMYVWFFQTSAIVWSVSINGDLEWEIYGLLYDPDTTSYNKIGGFGRTGILNTLYFEDDRYYDRWKTQLLIFNATDNSLVKSYTIIDTDDYMKWGAHKIVVTSQKFEYYFNDVLVGSYDVSAYMTSDYVTVRNVGSTTYALGARTNSGALTVADYMNCIIDYSMIKVGGTITHLVDPTFYNGTDYFDIVDMDTQASTVGTVFRVPSNMFWIWHLDGIRSDGKLHIMFVPNNTIVKLYSGSSLVAEYTVTGATNVIQDYPVDLASPADKVEMYIPFKDEYAFVSYVLTGYNEYTTSLYVKQYGYNLEVSPVIPPSIGDKVSVKHVYYGTNITFVFSYSGLKRHYIVKDNVKSPSNIVPTTWLVSNTTIYVEEAPGWMPIIYSVSGGNLTEASIDTGRSLVAFTVGAPPNTTVVIVIDPGATSISWVRTDYDGYLPLVSSYSDFVSRNTPAWYIDSTANKVYIKVVTHSNVTVTVAYTPSTLGGEPVIQPPETVYIVYHAIAAAIIVAAITLLATRKKLLKHIHIHIVS